MAGTPSLTTHVLDTMHGRPAAGMHFDLFLVHGDHGHHLLSGVTNEDGRADEPLLEDDGFQLGTYELVFHVGAYFKQLEAVATDPFLVEVPVRFTLSEMDHYHVPLLVSPYAYSTYRGS